MIKTACPLDCYDACAVLSSPDNPKKLIADSSHPLSNSKLCGALTNYFPKAQRLTKPIINGKEVTMEEALKAVAETLKNGDSLLWRGSGNLGVMQEITNLLMQEVNGYLTHGSLCDEAGITGILEGRGVNKQLSPKQIAKADVVVVWGRNIPVTNSHLMPFIKGKKLVVIDPRKTSLAKMADLHIQIKPRTDFYLAILLARFITMEDSQNDEWLESWGGDFEDFYDFTRTFRIKAILDYMELSLDDMGELMGYIQEEKVVFLVGAGVQKYSIGHYVLWAIDSLASTLGLFGKEGSGVSYFGSSRFGFENPFKVNLPTVPVATTEFEKFNSVIIQGGNPTSSMPNSNRVEESLKSVKNLIYFGIYENETSKLANIIIPAKTFLEKSDIRLSYGHNCVREMNKVYDSNTGISEYEFTKQILKILEKDNILKSENEYLNIWKSQAKTIDEELVSPNFEEIPYKNGFGEDGDEEFIFIDDFDDDFEDIKIFRKFRKNFHIESSKDKFWLLSPKYSKSINTQFERAKYLYVPPKIGINSGDEVAVSSEWGEIKLTAKIDNSLRDDTVLIYSSTPNVNRLTPPFLSEEGESSCFGEVKVSLKKINST